MNKYLRTIIIILLLSAMLFGSTADNIELGFKLTLVGAIALGLIGIMLLSIKKCYKFVVELLDNVFDTAEAFYNKVFKK